MCVSVLFQERCLRVVFLGVNLFSDKAILIILTGIRSNHGRRKRDVDSYMVVESETLGPGGCPFKPGKAQEKGLEKQYYQNFDRIMTA